MFDPNPQNHSMANALHRAGFTSTTDHLIRLATLAIDDGAGDLVETLDAFVTRIKNDVDEAELLWTLSAPTLQKNMVKVLRAAGMPKEAKPKPGRSSRAKEGMAAAAKAMRESIMETKVAELGKALGDCTKEEMLALAKRSAIKSHWYLKIGTPMPPMGTVRDFFLDKQIEKMQREAKKDVRS